MSSHTMGTGRRLLRWLGGNGLRHFVTWIALAFALFPIVWIFSASINPTGSLLQQKLIPDEVTWDNYRVFFTGEAEDFEAPFLLWLWNSTKLAVLTGVLGTLMCALAAYSFSRFRFTGRRAGLLGILLIQLFPQTLSMVAIYALLFTISRFFPFAGLNTHVGLLMVYLGGALGFNTWLMKGYFDSLPYSLEDSARVDGASHFQAFVRIILPLVRPILVVVFILIIVLVYGDFLLASILLQGREQYTLAVGLQTFITGNYSQRWGIFATAALIGAIPIVVFFLLLQDQLVSGLTSGSSKE